MLFIFYYHKRRLKTIFNEITNENDHKMAADPLALIERRRNMIKVKIVPGTVIKALY